MKAFQIALLLFGLALCGDVIAYETDALVSIRQDFSGLGAHTWELSLKKDGTVVEEQYNVYAKEVRSIDVETVVRRVPKREIRALVATAAKLIDGLPVDVGREIVVDPTSKSPVVDPATHEVLERIVVDPETKAIRIRFNGQKLFAGWSSYETTPPSDQTAQFQSAWQSLEHLLRTSGR